MGKKRAFVRYSKQGKVVPGSLILTAGSYPQGPSLWKEVPADLCCANHTISFNLRTGECQNGFNLGPSDPFPWNSNYIALEYGCAAMNPDTEWGYLYVPGTPADIYELASILNRRASNLGTWEVSRDGETLILNTSPDIAAQMCPEYLTDNLVFGVYED
jgi:hypothetical protein